MDEDRNQEPGKRLRTILSSHDGESNAQPQPQFQPQPGSPLSQLPRLKPSAPPTPLSDTQPVTPQASKQTPPSAAPPASSPQGVSSPQGASFPQGVVSSQAESSTPAGRPQRASSRPTPWPDQQRQGGQTTAGQGNGEPPRRSGLKLGPPFWTVTGLLSLVVNGILIAVLLAMMTKLSQLQGLQGQATNIGVDTLGGLYSNFEKMDRATIKTVIPVDAQIPLDISVPVQTTTQITLAESVAIPNAQVVINTGGLNINSNARVTLPAGTPMLVNLNFTLPVQTTIPVHLDVPVNIPMNQTELHEPFVGLQDVVRPLYCLVKSDASNLDGQLICR